MPTLEERIYEHREQLEARLIEREEYLDISPQMSEYIEMLEKYLLKLEERVVKMERQLRDNYLPIHITTN
ncbi:hypothetical protein JCM14469_39320 [Desulfatiferula olefinivorans]